MIEQKYIDNFWKKVDKTTNSNGCWLWTKCCDRDGYGVTGGPLQKYFKTDRVHRVSAALAGMDITTKPVVRHMCHNVKCLNPDHLKLGTHAENEKDKIEAGRNLFGEKHHQARLTENDVREIRSKYSSGKYKQWELGKMYGISRPAIGYIVYNKTWQHVT